MRRFAALALALGLAVGIPQPVAAVPTANYWPIGYHLTFVSWPDIADASTYAVFVNGVQVPVDVASTSSFSERGRIEATIAALLGPKDVVEVAVIDGTGVGPKVRASYSAYDYVYIPELNLRYDERETAPDAAALSRIRTFAQLLAQHGFTQMIAIGHDAGVVGAPNAYRLGQLRARAAAASIGRLVAVTAVTSSWGNSAPLESNATEVGRAENRRVELGLR